MNMASSAPPTMIEAVADEIRDAATSTKSTLNTKQVEYFCNEAARQYTAAEIGTDPEQIIQDIKVAMDKHIIRSNKPHAICDPPKLIKSFCRQVVDYEAKLAEVEANLQAANEQGSDKHNTRNYARIKKIMEEKEKLKSSKPGGDTEERWAMKKKFVLAYKKFMAAHELAVQGNMENQSAVELAADMDAPVVMNNNIHDVVSAPLQDISSSINNSNNIAANNSNIVRSGSTSSRAPKTQSQAEFQSRLREKAAKKEEEERRRKELQEKYIQDQLETNQSTREANRWKAEYYKRKVELVDQAKRQKLVNNVE
jgi:hypothetical protein